MGLNECLIDWGGRSGRNEGSDVLKSSYGCTEFFGFFINEERRSSTVTPSDLALATLFMGLFSILIFMWLFVFVSCFWQELIILNYVFAIFKLVNM